MLKNFVIAVVASAAMIGTSWAFWQEAVPSQSNPNPRPGSFAFFAPADPTLTLLKVPEVQTELKLEEDKAKKLDEINAESIRERTRLLAEFNAKVSELNKKTEGEALGLLSDAQRQRTEQLRLQRQGLRPMTTDAIAEKLGLTKTQRDEIAKLSPIALFGVRQDPASAPNERTRQMIQDNSKRADEAREKIFTLLTPEQKAKWSELTGEPFKFPTARWPNTR